MLTFIVILRKQFNAPFVPPLDGDISAVGPSQRRRYWSHVEESVYDRIKHLRFRTDVGARRQIEALIERMG